MARKISTIAAALLVWALFMAWVLRLREVFEVEQSAALARIEQDQDALRRLVRGQLAARLSERVEAARPRAERALSDPLVPAEGLVLFDGEEQRLPRAATPAVQTRARRIFATLPALPAVSAEEGPWAERLRLAVRVEAALGRRDDQAVEAAVLAFFRHRDRYVLEEDRDLATAVWILERLVAEARPSPRFLAAVLRDGLLRQAGLQRALASERVRLSAPDRDFLAGKVVRLSKLSGVRFDDFSRRLKERKDRAERPDVAGPALVDGRYFESDGERLFGVEVNLQTLLAAVRDDLTALGVFDAGDRIELSPEPVQPLADLAIDVVAGRIEEAKRRAVVRHREKSMLLLVAMVLAHALGAAGALLLLRHERTLEQRAEFVASVSHELRTPVASIRLLAETLERWADRAPRKASDYRARLIREADRLSFLVENILSYNRLARGRLDAHRVPVSLRELVHRMEEDLAVVAERPFEVVLEEDAELFVDPDLFGLVLLNLGRNAVDYGERSPVHIRVRRTPDGGIEVADDGPGMGPRERERIFRPFERGAAGRVRRAGGSGLGLAICRRVMAAHCGTIRVSASNVHGTTFEMRFDQ